MSNAAIVVLAFFIFAIGNATGGISVAWKYGLLTSTESATEVAQAQIDQAVEDSRQLGEARATADRSAQDAQVQIKTVTKVVRECPPGTGVLSPAKSERLRDLLRDPAGAEGGDG